MAVCIDSEEKKTNMGIILSDEKECECRTSSRSREGSLSEEEDIVVYGIVCIQLREVDGEYTAGTAQLSVEVCCAERSGGNQSRMPSAIQRRGVCAIVRDIWRMGG